MVRSQAERTITTTHSVIHMSLSGNSARQNLESYLHYIENYDYKMAEKERSDALNYIDLQQTQFVIYLIKRLINTFIYGVIEQSRRRSISEMLQACQGNVTNESFRQRILSYFNLSHYSSFVEKSMENFDYLRMNLESIINEISVPVEASDLRGQVARQLEAYPKNPPLLLLRSLAEAYCSDKKEEVVFENFVAYLNFSENAWGRKIEEILELVTRSINLVGETDTGLAEELVVATLDFFPEDKRAQELILNGCDAKYTTYFIYDYLGRMTSLARRVL